jgi:hypothetical protein
MLRLLGEPCRLRILLAALDAYGNGPICAQRTDPRGAQARVRRRFTTESIGARASPSDHEPDAAMRRGTCGPPVGEQEGWMRREALRPQRQFIRLGRSERRIVLGCIRLIGAAGRLAVAELVAACDSEPRSAREAHRAARRRREPDRASNRRGWRRVSSRASGSRVVA